MIFKKHHLYLLSKNVVMSMLCKEYFFRLREDLGWIPFKPANSAPETRNSHNEFKRTCCNGIEF